MQDAARRLRIAQWGTGLVGAAAARKVLEHPQYELVGCLAYSKSKAGQDVGTLLGLDPIGIAATSELEQLIAVKPDCVLYMPLLWNVDDMARLLSAGINVISTANFVTGRSFGAQAVEKLERAAHQGGASLYGTGINPGQATILALTAAAACAKVRRITVREAVDATAYASRDTWISLGFGGPPDVPGLADRVKERTLVFMDAIEMMAAALQVTLEDIVFSVDFATANEDLQLGYLDIPRGTVCALRMSHCGIANGKRLIEMQLIWRLGYSMTPDWPVEGYVIEIEGEPNVRATLSAEKGRTGSGTTTAMNAVHAIAAVCAARPGIVTAAELPLITAAYCVATD